MGVSENGVYGIIRAIHGNFNGKMMKNHWESNIFICFMLKIGMNPINYKLVFFRELKPPKR